MRPKISTMVEVIREQQWTVAWENYVHDCFRDKTAAGDTRRKHVLLDLSSKAEPVLVGKFAEISVRVAAAYARKTKRTIVRDINVLLEMGLIEFSKSGFRARKEAILAFLPTRAHNESD